MTTISIVSLLMIYLTRYVSERRNLQELPIDTQNKFSIEPI